MNILRALRSGFVVLPIVLTGCVVGPDSEQYMKIDAGFSTVSAKTRQSIGKKTVWVQNQGEAKALSKHVHGLIHKKRISAGTAVQVALLNNRGLQAAYTKERKY